MKNMVSIAAAVVASLMLGPMQRDACAGPMENTQQFMEKAIRTATNWPDDVSDYVTGVIVKPPKDIRDIRPKNEVRLSNPGPGRQYP